MLQATIAKMPEEEAVYYMKRCVDSGLWVPGKNDEPTMKEDTKDTPSASTDDVDWLRYYFCAFLLLYIYASIYIIVYAKDYFVL